MEKSRESGEGRGLATSSQTVAGLPTSLQLVLKVLVWLSFFFLAVCAFPPFELAEGAYLFAVPLLLSSIWLPPLKGERWIRLLVCLSIWWVLLFWVSHFSSHLETSLAKPMGLLAWLALGSAMGAFLFVWVEAAIPLLKRSLSLNSLPRLMVLLGLAGFWVVLEWIRTWLLSGFPWLPLAASQYDRTLILQVASWTGAYGVSFILISFNLGLVYYLQRLAQNRKKGWLKRLSPEFYLAIFLLGGGIALGTWSAQFQSRRTEPVKVAFVQPAAPGKDKWDSASLNEVLSDIDRLTELAGLLEPDLLLWPETPIPYAIYPDSWTEGWIEDQVSKQGISLLFGGLVAEFGENPEDRKLFNGVLLVSQGHGVNYSTAYYKQKLVPFGERVPFNNLFGLLDTVVPLNTMLSAGSEPSVLPVEIREQRFDVGALVCYEDLFPNLARQQVKSGADLLYVVTNDLWFGEWAAAEQHMAHSVLRAVEMRRPVLRCGNAGWSGWIDEFGTIRHQMVDGEGSIYFQGIDTAEVTLSRYWKGRQSVYVRFGDWFVGLSLLLTLAMIPVLRQKD